MQKKNILKLIGLSFAGFLFLTTTGTAEGALLKKYTAITNNNWNTTLWNDGATDWAGDVAKIIFNAPAGSAMATYLQAGGNGTYIWRGGSFNRAQVTNIRTEPDGSISGDVVGAGDVDGIGYFLRNVTLGSTYFPDPSTLCFNGSGATGGTCGGAFNGSGDMYLFSSLSDSLTPPACVPDTIANGTIGAYPTCAISCNSGYVENAGVCEAVAVAGATLGVSTSTSEEVLGMLSDTIGGEGVLGIIVLIISITLLFYIIENIKVLFPGNKKK